MSTSAGMLGGGWLWLHLPAITALSACARDAARTEEPFSTMSPAEGRAMRAFAARIIPSDADVPGAEEAGAAWFVDQALAGPFAAMKEPLLAGLADLDQRAQTAHNVPFANATPEQQDAIITAVAADQDQPFFYMARMLTIAGVFADPSYGGNRDHVGATILGMEHAPAFQPPFGYYDQQIVALGGAP